MDPLDAERLARKLIDRHLDSTWSFGWNRRIRHLGMCNFRERQISLSRKLVPALSEADVTDTALHEIAHALAGPHAGHGPAWQSIAKSLGATPRARASVALAEDQRPKPTWVCLYEGEIVARYYRKPSKALRNLSTLYVRGRKRETMGKLRIVPWSERYAD